MARTKHNKNVLEDWRKNPIPIYLMSCYAYEKLDASFISDNSFDRLGRYIEKNWRKIRHRHKRYINKEDVAFTSAITCNYDDLPSIVKNATVQLLKEKNILFTDRKNK